MTTMARTRTTTPSLSVTPTTITTAAVVNASLQKIVDKLEGSHVLNGGFEEINRKVEKLEEITGKTGETVDKIHERLYSPEDGMIVQLNNVESSVKKMEEQILPKVSTTLQSHGMALRDFNNLQKTINKIFWIAVTATTAGALKVLWDYLQHTHVITF